jgi:hypothetical protein
MKAKKSCPKWPLKVLAFSQNSLPNQKPGSSPPKEAKVKEKVKKSIKKKLIWKQYFASKSIYIYF